MKEKIQVFHLPRRISTSKLGLPFAAGAISILMSVEYLLGAELLLTFEVKPLFLAVLTFIGLINMVCGLPLLAKE